MPSWVRHILAATLALLTSLAMLALLVLLLRLQWVGPGLTIYFAIPVVVLVTAVVRAIRRRQFLLLTYGITYFITAILFFGVFTYMLFMALKSFS